MKKKSQLRTMILGSSPLLDALYDEITSRPGCNYLIVENKGADFFNGQATKTDFHRLIIDKNIEAIIVGLTPGGNRDLEQLLLEEGLFNKLKIKSAVSVYEKLTGKLPIEAYEPVDFLFSDVNKPRRFSLFMNRMLSLTAALLGGMVMSPVLFLIAVLIKLDSRGPILFIQERSGLAGKKFKLMKFRTMKPAFHTEGSAWEKDNIHRITRVGGWLRKYRLDELPQFFNIIQGHMNLVGPRPHPACNYDLFVLASRNMPESGAEIPYYFLRSLVRPGITGWAQVNYRYANNLQEEIEKLRFDLYYIKYYSWWLDIYIIFKTVWTVVSGAKGQKEESRRVPVREPVSQHSSGFQGS